MQPEFEGKLFDILQKEESVLVRLGATAQRKKAAVARGDIPALDACLNEETPLTMELHALETARTGLLEHAGLESWTLTQLAKEAGGDGGRRLNGLLFSMRTAARKLHRLNDCNSGLLRARLRCYAGAASGLASVYSPEGANNKAAAGASRMNRKA